MVNVNKPKLFSAAVLLVAVAGALVVWHARLGLANFSRHFRPGSYFDLDRSALTLTSMCPDVLTGMMRGRWRQGEMTDVQKQERADFYRKVRRDFGLPATYQQKNNKCGNVHFPSSSHLRALCDPQGSTPCCYDNVCRNKTTAQCSCPDCIDMRTAIHAEYSTWLPADARCEPIRLSVPEMCRLLEGSVVFFWGDSLVRHFYKTFLMTVRQDDEYGAMKPNAKKGDREKCRGENIFRPPCNRCPCLDSNASLCNGTARARFVPHYKPPHPQAFIRSTVVEISRLRQAASRTVLVLGFGSHFQLNHTLTWRAALGPILRGLEEAGQGGHGGGGQGGVGGADDAGGGGGGGGGSVHRRPSFKIVWAAFHSPSFQMTQKYEGSALARSQAFNRGITRSLRDERLTNDVTIFDTMNMTSQMIMGRDGNHYGMAVNKLKATFLLNYLLELRGKGEF